MANNNNSKCAIVTFSEIITSTATKLGMKAEDVEKVERAIPGVQMDLVKDKFMSGATQVITQGSTVALNHKLKESGEKPNPDGTKTKIGTNIVISAAISEDYLKNAQTIIPQLTKTVKAAIPAVKAIASLAKAVAA